jgi:hypothetical protein
MAATAPKIKATGLETGNDASLLFGTPVGVVVAFKDELLKLVETVDLVDVLVVVEFLAALEKVVGTEVDDITPDEAGVTEAEDAGIEFEATPPVRLSGPQ